MKEIELVNKMTANCNGLAEVIMGELALILTESIFNILMSLKDQAEAAPEYFNGEVDNPVAYLTEYFYTALTENEANNLYDDLQIAMDIVLDAEGILED